MEPKKELTDTMRGGRVYEIDPTLTNLDKRLVIIPDEPRKKDAEPEPKTPACLPRHRQAQDDKALAAGREMLK